jgi:hypothetical protein
MKNLKKLSRVELRTLTGAGPIGGPFPAVCIYTHKWCENLKMCIPKNGSCDLKPYEPGTDGGF